MLLVLRRKIFLQLAFVQLLLPAFTNTSIIEQEPEAWTLDGKPLFAPTFEGLVGAGLEAQLAMAIEELAIPPSRDPSKHTWLGRQYAYQWHYQRAIKVYSTALTTWQRDAQLLRHRGHCYISTRNFTKAQGDLERAQKLISINPITDKRNQEGWERDGKPNQYNLPLYSRHCNVHYHLGLARYLQGDFEGAVEAYDRIPVSKDHSKFVTNDSVVAVVYWKYMALRRAGHAADSPRVVDTLDHIYLGMPVLDVETYLQLGLFFKGSLPLSNLTNWTEPLDFATIGYGIGNYYYMINHTQQAMDVWHKVTQNGTYWPAFGFIASEADLYRLKPGDAGESQFHYLLREGR